MFRIIMQDIYIPTFAARLGEDSACGHRGNLRLYHFFRTFTLVFECEALWNTLHLHMTTYFTLDFADNSRVIPLATAIHF